MKEAVFPFARFGDKVDTVLGPEMKSTGEVMGLDRDYASPSPRASSAAAPACPRTARCSSRSATPTSRGSWSRSRPCGASASRSSRPPAPSVTWPRTGSRPVKINKVAEGRPHIVDAIKNGQVQLVFNTTEGATALADSRSLRRAALLHKVPYYTTLSGAVAAAQGIKAYLGGDLEVRALQSYFGGRPDRPTVETLRRVGTSSFEMRAEGNFGPRLDLCPSLLGGLRSGGKDSDDRGGPHRA